MLTRLAPAVALAVLSPLALVPVLTPAPAQAAVTGTVSEGTATWGTSTYLASANVGRPNPLGSAYVAPAAFDAATRLSTWGDASGVVAPDGSAELTFEGTSVNWASTSGSFLRISDLALELDATGNGSMTGLVEYGTSAGTYDPTVTPTRTGTVEILEIAGNTADDVDVEATGTTWTDLASTWSPDFIDFVNGNEDPAIAAWTYHVTFTSAADRQPLPLTLAVDTATPEVTTEVTGASYTDGLTVAVTGDGFRGVTNPGDAGIYLGLYPVGGPPDLSTPASMGLFAAVAYVPALPDGTFAATLQAPTDKLDPAEEYAVYTWQAHAHSNTTQDTETPVAIDWQALEQRDSTVTPGGPTKVAYADGATLTATVEGPGTVTLTGVGAAREADVVDGVATFVVPASLAARTYAATFTYSGGGDYLGSAATRTLTVLQAGTATTMRWKTKPTAKKSGQAVVTVRGVAASKPAGRVTFVVARQGRSRTVKGKLANGVVTLTVPKLAAGTYHVRAVYAGSTNYAGSKVTGRLVVR